MLHSILILGLFAQLWVKTKYASNFHSVRFRRLQIPSPGGIYLSKLTIETLEQRCETCSKLTIKTPKRRHWRRFGVFIVNFEHISHLCSSVSIANF